MCRNYSNICSANTSQENQLKAQKQKKQKDNGLKHIARKVQVGNLRALAFDSVHVGDSLFIYLNL